MGWWFDSLVHWSSFGEKYCDKRGFVSSELFDVHFGEEIDIICICLEDGAADRFDRCKINVKGVCYAIEKKQWEKSNGNSLLYSSGE